LDSDDTLINESISALVKVAESNKSDIVMPDRYILKTKESGHESLAFLFPEKFHVSDPKEFALDVMIANGRGWRATALLYKYDVIQKSRALFPFGHTSEDFFFNLQIMKYANRITFFLN